jgi:hypothetical protein
MSRSFWSRLGGLASGFFIAFSAVALAQYWFVGRELRETARRQLEDSAAQVREDIAFKSSWDLVGYRRTTSEGAADSVLIVSKGGTIVDASNYVPGMTGRVSIPFKTDFDRPFHVTSELGEQWLVDVRRLIDGTVILGARVDGLPIDVESRIETNAKHFGGTVADALRVKERSIDELFDYAILDANGILRETNSAIPLETDPPAVPATPIFSPVQEIDGALYAVLEDPLVDKSGRPVGIVRVFKDITDEQEVLRVTAIFNAAVAITLSLVAAIAVVIYRSRFQTLHISCSQLADLDESDRVEFKSSLRWDYRKQEKSGVMEEAVAKAVVGFLNSERGGTLIIGLDDRKVPLGLDADYATFKSVKPDRDGFEQVLRDVLIRVIGEAQYIRHVRVRFCHVADKDVCLVEVAPSDEAIYLQGQLYVRAGNATRPLNMKDAIDYAAKRWPTPVLNWPIHLRRPAAHTGL